MRNKVKKRGISLLSLIIIIICIIIAIVVIVQLKNKNIFNKNTENIQQIGKKDNKEKEHFSFSMLEDNGIGKKATLTTLRKKFENLKQDKSYVEGKTGDNIDEYSNEDVQIILRNNTLTKIKINSGDFEINGIKVGDSSNKIENAFDEGEKKEATSEKIIYECTYNNYIANLIFNIRENNIEYIMCEITKNNE